MAITSSQTELRSHLEEEALEAVVLRKVTWRLVPFLFLLYMLNILDRVNIGFARLQMMDELGMSENVYGFGAGLFFIGYFIFEVPSNLILKRTGARRWIGRIMISWGIVSACMMFVRTSMDFYLLRFALGVAEAGFFPGIILYVSYWFPARQRARAVSRFMTAAAVTGALGGPASGAIMEFLDQSGGLSGWQWLFLLEGFPTIFVGFWTFKYLTDRPAKAAWLTSEERDWLMERMRREERPHDERHGFTLLRSLLEPRVLLLCAVYFCVAMGSNSFGPYLPVVLSETFKGAENKFYLGLLAAVPSICGIIAMVAVGLHSDLRCERHWHMALSAFAAAGGWVMVGLAEQPFLVLAGLALAYAGMMSTFAPFWSLSTSVVSSVAAAGSIAFINSVGNLGGFVGPLIISWFKVETKSFTGGFLCLACSMVLCGILALRAKSS